MARDAKRGLLGGACPMNPVSGRVPSKSRHALAHVVWRHRKSVSQPASVEIFVSSDVTECGSFLNSSTFAKGQGKEVTCLSESPRLSLLKRTCWMLRYAARPVGGREAGGGRGWGRSSSTTSVNYAGLVSSACLGSTGDPGGGHGGAWLAAQIGTPDNASATTPSDTQPSSLAARLARRSLRRPTSAHAHGRSS